MSKRIIALGAAAAVTVALVPAVPAFAADEVVTGVVTVDGAPVTATALTVGWYDPDSGEHGSTQTDAADGSYELTVPDGVDSFFLTANLVRSGANWARPGSGRAYGAAFVGEGDEAGLAWQTLDAPYAVAPVAVDIEIGGTGSIDLSDVPPDSASLVTVDGREVRDLDDVAGGELESVIPGEYRVVWTPDTTDAENLGFAPPLPRTSDVFEVVAGETVSVDLPVTAGATISGRLTYRGAPVSDGSVVRAYAVSEGASASVRSVYERTWAELASDGEFELSNLAAGTYRVVIDSPSGLALYGSKTVTVGTGEHATLDLNSTKGGTIRGSVGGTGSKEKVTIMLASAQGELLDSVTRTGSGAYSFANRGPGDYRIYVKNEARKRWTYTSVTVRPGTTKTVGILRPTKTLATVKVTVPTAAGTTGRTVVFNGLDTKSAGVSTSTNVATFTDVIPVPTAQFWATAYPSYQPHVITKRIGGSTSFSLTLGDAWSTLSGTLTVDGEPVDGTVTASTPFDLDAVTVDASSANGFALDAASFAMVRTGPVKYAYAPGPYSYRASIDDIVIDSPVSVQLPEGASSPEWTPTSGTDLDLGEVPITLRW